MSIDELFVIVEDSRMLRDTLKETFDSPQQRGTERVKNLQGKFTKNFGMLTVLSQLFSPSSSNAKRKLYFFLRTLLSIGSKMRKSTVKAPFPYSETGSTMPDATYHR